MEIQTSADQLMYSTHRICALHSGKTIGTGTAFNFRFGLSNGSFVNGLVTNKHVIIGADAIEVRIHMRHSNGKFTDEGRSVTMILGDGVIYHPDTDVDLCFIPHGGWIEFAGDGKVPFGVALSPDDIPTDTAWGNFDSIVDVWMIGCPNGIYDTVNNLPIARSGITATSPRLLYKGKHEFVVDMACFPGSSGSPIFSAPSFITIDRTTNSSNFGPPTRSWFLGILYAGPLITSEGKIVLGSSPRVEVASMMHLGYAIRSTRILDFKLQIDQQLRAQGLPPLAP